MSENRDPKKTLADLKGRRLVDCAPQDVAQVLQTDPEIAQVMQQGAKDVMQQGELLAQALQRFLGLNPKLQAKIRSQIQNLAHDLVFFLGMSHLDEEQRLLVLMLVLQFRDDDDGDEEPDPQPNTPGDLVPA
jgi:hypothetical protein